MIELGPWLDAVTSSGGFACRADRASSEVRLALGYLDPAEEYTVDGCPEGVDPITRCGQILLRLETAAAPVRAARYEPCMVNAMAVTVRRTGHL